MLFHLLVLRHVHDLNYVVSLLQKKNLRESLQTCSVEFNEMKLEGLLAVLKEQDGRKGNMLRALLFILNKLLAPSKNKKSIGFMPFDDAYDLYCGFFSGNLLHPEYGLTVFIVNLDIFEQRGKR